MKDNTLRESNAKVNRMVNELETITYYKHHYVRKTGLKKAIKALLADEVRKARLDELKRNAYYSQPRKTDPPRLCGIDMEEEQVNKRITELEKEGK